MRFLKYGTGDYFKRKSEKDLFSFSFFLVWIFDYPLSHPRLLLNYRQRNPLQLS